MFLKSSCHKPKVSCGWDGHDDEIHHGQGFLSFLRFVGDDRYEGVSVMEWRMFRNIRHLNGLLGLVKGIFQQILVFQVFLNVAGGTGRISADHANSQKFSEGLEVDDEVLLIPSVQSALHYALIW